MTRMRWPVLCVWICACGADAPAADHPSVTVDAEPAPATSSAPLDEPGPKPAPTSQPDVDCHHSCCSAEMREMQRKAAGGDPSIEYECCMCDGG